jgi:hypothetical protein
MTEELGFELRGRRGFLLAALMFTEYKKETRLRPNLTPARVVDFSTQSDDFIITYSTSLPHFSDYYRIIFSRPGIEMAVHDKLHQTF